MPIRKILCLYIYTNTNILRLSFTFISKKQKISRLNRLIYCEMIFTFLFS
nr:MAG TPA: hypothetical protein [Caudoviricetes sp.]